MPFTWTRPLGATTLGVSSAVLAQVVQSDPTNVNLNKFVLGLLTAAVIGIPIWAGQQDGGVVEAGEGAFDGLAALLAKGATQIIMTQPVQIMGQTSGGNRAKPFPWPILTVLAPP